MAFMKKIFVSSGLILLLSLSLKFYQDHTEKSNRLIFEEWSDQNKIDLYQIKLSNFKIEFNQAEWDNLLQRLQNTRYFNVLNESFVDRFEYGFDPEYAQKLIDYWQTKFDWKKNVDYLNKFEQYKIEINGVDVHFLRVRTNTDSQDSIPLLLVDGWPGSFVGFYKMIEYFIEQNAAYDVIVPSIPGFGYSTPLNKPVGIIEVSSYFDAIMRLIHGDQVQYFIHGEDWGAVLASTMAHLYPQRVKGIHSTMPVFDPFFSIQSTFHILLSSIFPTYLLSAQEVENKFYERYSITSFIQMFVNDMGYLHLQSTKPDTLAHGLTDSPVGLLAYILEKYSSWSFNKNEIVGNPSGNLEKFSENDLLTITSIYWFTNSISSSVRLYKSHDREITTYPASLIVSIKSEVPIAVQLDYNELLSFPSNAISQKFPNLKAFKIVNDAGHFAAFKNPQTTGDNIIEFINSFNLLTQLNN